ncbi:hypothetical protein [Williamsia serinedens]|uniref:hypothetical protein n=1 Tax=Williamsia serinedens TaxID=391736 RepID=UPI0020A2F198|nr:hypothetical protein [Williamsia serinedens]
MRFTVEPRGRYFVVTDAQTGAQWPYTTEVAANQAAVTANTDATAMRNHIAATPPDATLPPEDEPVLPVVDDEGPQTTP